MSDTDFLEDRERAMWTMWEEANEKMMILDSVVLSLIEAEKRTKDLFIPGSLALALFDARNTIAQEQRAVLDVLDQLNDTRHSLGE